MKNILITGATGNIGYQVLKHLVNLKAAYQTGQQEPFRVFAAVRNKKSANAIDMEFPGIGTVEFDFTDPSTFQTALRDIDCLFLLRPPQLADINIFTPLISKAKENNVKEIVFLSVQGAEKSKVIPHNKIETLILESGINYIFVRPSYFMQNLTTTLLPDIINRKEIFLPAGKGKFNWVDVDNIAETCAILMNRFNEYSNTSYEITGYENLDFYTVTQMINEATGAGITYRSVDPFTFWLRKKRDGEPAGKIIVMFMLHFLPRIQAEPKISGFYHALTSKEPTTLKEFIDRNKQTFVQN